jgi:acetyl esterase/lipase
VKRRLLALATAVLGALATLNAYRPLSNKGYPSVAAVFFGVVASELPRETLAVQGGALAALTPRLSPRVRLIAWLISVASAVGLLGLDRISRRARVSLTAALDGGLGSDRRTDSAALWHRPAPHGATAKTPGVVRMLRIYRDYAHSSDISYGPYGRANHLDIWRRTDLRRDGHSPVLLQVPGGAWVTGNKRGQAHPLMSHLAELGWICVSINYRLGPRNTWPDQIVDVKQAITWVKAHIADYGGDPHFIAVTGGSAGAHLSSLAALTPNDPRFQPGFADADTRVQAAIPFYGVYDLTGADARNHPNLVPLLEKSVIKQTLVDGSATFRAASPLTYVSADAPPFFVVHGRNDTFLPVEQARVFVARLREVSTQPVVYAELPIAQHAFDIFGSVRAARAAVAVEQFLAEIYARTSAPLRQRA